VSTFKEFLISMRVIPEKRVPFYLLWVRRFQESTNKKAGEDFSEEELKAFAKSLEKDHEEWQVKQAKEAVDLYRFYLRRISGGYDIRTIQELLGHSHVQTTMIYTRVAAKNKLGVRSPLDM